MNNKTVTLSEHERYYIVKLLEDEACRLSEIINSTSNKSTIETCRITKVWIKAIRGKLEDAET